MYEENIASEVFVSRSDLADKIACFGLLSVILHRKIYLQIFCSATPSDNLNNIRNLWDDIREQLLEIHGNIIREVENCWLSGSDTFNV